MTQAARERRKVRTPVLLISTAAWSLLLFAPVGTALHNHHSAAMAGTSTSFSMLLMHNPPGSLAVGWVLMLAAMMTPLLIAPVRHVRDRSFARRRPRSITLFVIGYTAVWMVVGLMMLAMALAARMTARESYVPLALAAALAVVWQFSPAKQRCLNRAHAHSELAAFGRAADFDVLRFGVDHGIWCVGSCWAVMLLPLLISTGHLAAMAAVSLWMFAERLKNPKTPRWEFRIPTRAMRLVVAQTRMRLIPLS